MPIVKELTHSLRRTGASPNFGGMLRYIFRKEAGLVEQKSGKQMVVTHNLFGQNQEAWEKEFLEQFIRSGVVAKGRTGLFHQILSWRAADSQKLTIEMVEDCVRKYLDLRHPEASAISVGHFSGKDHYHAHVVANGIRFTDGHSNRVSRSDYLRIVQEINQYQKEKYPELSSVVEVGKGQGKSKGAYWLEKTGRISKQDLLKALVEDALKEALTKVELIEFLKREGIEYYERGPRSAGVEWQGTRFRLAKLGVQDGMQELAEREARMAELSALRGPEQARSVLLLPETERTEGELEKPITPLGTDGLER